MCIYVYICIYIYRHKIQVWKRPFGCAMSSDVAVTHTNYILKYDWVHAELYKWDVTPAQLRKKYPGNEFMEPKKGRAPVSRRNKTNLEILASGSSSSISIDEKFLSLTPFLLKSNMTRRVSFTSPGIDDFFKQKKCSATTKWASTSSEWSDGGLYTWPYKWATGSISF